MRRAVQAEFETFGINGLAVSYDIDLARRSRQAFAATDIQYCTLLDISLLSPVTHSL
jgi:hypothetical protein